MYHNSIEALSRYLSCIPNHIICEMKKLAQDVSLSVCICTDSFLNTTEFDSDEIKWQLQVRGSLRAPSLVFSVTYKNNLDKLKQ